jgi:hypothetical protein
LEVEPIRPVFVEPIATMGTIKGWVKRTLE